jgi:hypothetical protein
MSCRILSWLLQPYAVAAYTVIAFCVWASTWLGQLRAAAAAVLGIALLAAVPAMCSLYLYTKGADVNTAGDRALMYPPAAASYLAAATLFWLLNIKILFVLAIAYMAVSAMIFAIGTFWKISIHSAGVAGPTTALIFVFGLALLPLYVLTAAIIWARLKLAAHTLAQLVAGALVAIVITSLVYLVLW